MEPWKQNEIDGRLAHLQGALAALAGRNAMQLLALKALIASHPDQEKFRETLRPLLAELEFPTPAYREGFDQVLEQVRAALADHPVPPTGST